MSNRTIVAALAVLFGVVAGCEGENGTRGIQSVPPTNPPTLDDAQVGGMLLTANQGEVKEAQAARPKLTAQDAITLADRIVMDHTAAQQREATLFQQQAITPAPSDVTDMLMSDTNTNVQALESMPPGSFADLTYLCMQVRDHTQLVMLIDARASAVSNAPLKNEVSLNRQTAQMHLALAQAGVVSVAGNGDLMAACAPYGGATP